MPSATSVLLAVVFLFGTAFGQAAVPASETFHVRGTITDQSGAVIPRAKVAFQNKQFDKTVTTSERGVYETDLPFGNYTMTAEVLGFRPYRRPLFRVTSAETITFDFTLPVRPTCDIQVVRSDGGTPTPEDLEAAKRQFCLREDFFSVPSSDGVPFQVWIRYVKHNESGDTHFYTGEKAPNDDPVLVAYNLFSLRADKAVYDANSRTIKATGNVVAVDKFGVTQSADSMTFEIENGQAIPIQ
ncbi:MAG: carboxypeptidase-like regulatory domain-containing protein [Terriglobales bacterium]